MSRRKLLGEKYRIGEVIGHGAFATVYYCTDITTLSKYAVKVLSKHKLRDAGMEDAFEREVACFKMLSPSPYLTNLIEVLQSTRNYYLVMDLADGGTLLTMIAKNGGLVRHVIRKYFKQLIEGLKDIHESGVVHRDIKPENLLLDDYRDIRIADFSFAAAADDSRMLKRQCGTPHYVAPEVLTGQGYSGRAADVWSLGVTLYVMVFGQLPFVAPDTDILYERIAAGRIVFPLREDGSCRATEALQHLISVCLRVDPHRRWTLEKISRHPFVLGKEQLTHGLRGFHGSGSNVASPSGGVLGISASALFPTDENIQNGSFVFGQSALEEIPNDDFVQMSSSCPAIVWKKYLPGDGSKCAVSMVEAPVFHATTRTLRRKSRGAMATPELRDPTTPAGGQANTPESRTGHFLKRLGWHHISCAVHLATVSFIVLVVGSFRLLFDVHVADIPMPRTLKDFLESVMTPPVTRAETPASTTTPGRRPLASVSPQLAGGAPRSQISSVFSGDDLAAMDGTTPPPTSSTTNDILVLPPISGYVDSNDSGSGFSLKRGSLQRTRSTLTSLLGGTGTANDDDLVDTLKKGSLVYEKGDWGRRAGLNADDSITSFSTASASVNDYSFGDQPVRAGGVLRRRKISTTPQQGDGEVET